MIEFYTLHSLEPNFPALKTTLGEGFGEKATKCIAQYDFEARTTDELSLEVCERNHVFEVLIRG